MATAATVIACFVGFVALCIGMLPRTIGHGASGVDWTFLSACCWVIAGSVLHCCRAVQACTRSDLRRGVLARSNHAPFSLPFVLAALVWLQEPTTCGHLLEVRDASTEVLMR